MPFSSRSIPQFQTVLIVVEGETEFAFCRYLKSLAARGHGVKVTIKNAFGGSPDSIVERTCRLTKYQAEYDRIVILFDTDKPLKPSGEKKARALRARLFRFSPCIEGFFLDLMGQKVPQDTDSCKRIFHELGLDEKAKLNYGAYAGLFPADKIDQLAVSADFAALWGMFQNEGGAG